MKIAERPFGFADGGVENAEYDEQNAGQLDKAAGKEVYRVLPVTDRTVLNLLKALLRGEDK